MQYRQLGRSELKVSTVALGCWAFAGGELWGDHEQAEIDQIVASAVDQGINLFDTAEAYGGGTSEQRLAQALGDRRKDVLIATKVSPGNTTRASLRKSCEASLRRLNTDYIDLYQIHWPVRDAPLADALYELEQLHREGKIRVSGVSNYGPLDMEDLIAAGHAESNQLLYSLLARMIEDEVIPRCIEQQVGILCYSPLAQGMLTGKWRSVDEVPEVRARTRHFSSSRPGTIHTEDGCEEKTFSALDHIREIAANFGQPMDTITLAWCLHKPGITSVLAGARSPEHVIHNASAADLALSTSIMSELDAATTPVKEHLAPNLDILCDAVNTRYR